MHRTHLLVLQARNLCCSMGGFSVLAAVVFLGFPAQQSGAFFLPSFAPTKNFLPAACWKVIQQDVGHCNVEFCYSKLRRVTITAPKAVASIANSESATLRTLASGIKAVGVGKKGSKPIPQDLVPELIQIVRYFETQA